MFQTIYTFRSLSFQNSARRAVPQILFITHSAKIISVHTAPPMAQMLRNLQLCLDPDIRVEAICVRRKCNAMPRDSGCGNFFYKYQPNLCSGRWGSRCIYVCFGLLVAQGACSPRHPQGLLSVPGGRARTEPSFIPEDRPCPCPCPGRQPWSGAVMVGLGLCHCFLALLPPKPEPYLPRL